MCEGGEESWKDMRVRGGKMEGCVEGRRDGDCAREGRRGGGMCEGGEKRWRDVRLRGRKEDGNGERERYKRLLTPVRKCAYSLVLQQRRVFGQLQHTNTKLSMFCPNSP